MNLLGSASFAYRRLLADEVRAGLTVLGMAIGTVSLVISGIGIMNIMLVTVTERIKEPGIRMPAGAPCRQVLFQFLSKAVSMASVGGGLGIILGVSRLAAAGWIAGITILIFSISIVLAFILSFIVGITSGLIPASRAAKLDPTEALRYE